ncbi:MAG: 2-amino-4-hydroxy-6-hydroxymethyldihydropteridine diphosphokinase [Terriglobales bacterium]
MRAYVALGSNRGDRARNLARALDAMPAAAISVRRLSAVEETQPVGATGRRRFLNAVAEVSTGLSPRVLLRRLRQIERRLGRHAGGGRNRPRTVDLDLLLYGRARVGGRELALPHPRFAQRGFVLDGLAELAPSLRAPGSSRSMRQLRRRL